MTPTQATLDRLFREHGAQLRATVIRYVRDFDLAEEAIQVAYEAALVQWPSEGLPESPKAWVLRTAQRRAIDLVRHRKMADAKLRALAETSVSQVDAEEPTALPDDLLRLFFTCCHPALALEAQVALTLRIIAGLTTEEIARAFLVPPTTMAQRLVRAKRKIVDAGIPYRVPESDELGERLDGVLAAIYLVFTEGYAATSGEALLRVDLATEAIRLARLVTDLLPDRAEARGLLALCLLTDARRAARVDDEGRLVTLDEQDRAKWDAAQIAEGRALVPDALSKGRLSGYAIQAAIAALHAEASSPGATDWKQIAALYAFLARLEPSPVVDLNHAVAVAMVDGPEQGLRLLDALDARGTLDGFHLLHASRADLLRRLGRHAEARSAYEKALSLTGNEAERRFLAWRLASHG